MAQFEATGTLVVLPVGPFKGKQGALAVNAGDQILVPVDQMWFADELGQYASRTGREAGEPIGWAPQSHPLLGEQVSVVGEMTEAPDWVRRNSTGGDPPVAIKVAYARRAYADSAPASNNAAGPSVISPNNFPTLTPTSGGVANNQVPGSFAVPVNFFPTPNESIPKLSEPKEPEAPAPSKRKSKTGLIAVLSLAGAGLLAYKLMRK